MTRFRLVEAEKALTPVKVSCELLGVSRSGYYAWEGRSPCQRELTDAWILEKIKEIHQENRGVYGAPRIHAELRMAHGVRVGRKRVERLMKAAGISGLVKKKRGKTTIRVPGVRVADDLLLRDFTATEPNTKWVADITYLRTWQGWVYLAAVQDLYSRRIVGWSMADHMRSELVTDALEMAIRRRRPDPGLIHHSDQGSQYVSLAFGQTARINGIARSMGKVGTAYDNSVAETFFATLKKELIYRRKWPERQELRTEVFEYIESFYNRKRRHSRLGWVSPVEFEETRQPTSRVQALSSA
ncbi:MAG: IS3 family transposase [Thermoleophilia bacterium]|nr:IS3 family transposase [Thermoleophilia bacterium]